MKTDRTAVLAKFNSHCAYCGELLTLDTLHVDHVIPKSNFLWHIKNRMKIPDFLKHIKETDVDHPDNLFPACGVCNRWKSVYSLEDFRREIFMQTARLDKTSASFRMAKRYKQIQYTYYSVTFYFEKFPQM